MASSLSFPGFVWKNLKRRRLRTLLTLFGIGMAIGAFVGLVGFSRAFEEGWQRIYSSSGIDIAVIQQTFLNTSMDESVGAKLKAVPVVAQAAPMIYNVMDLTPEVNALVYGWKADSFEFQSLKLLSGQPFHDGKAEVMLGDLLAEDLKKKPGDTLEIQGTSFKVAAIGQQNIPWPGLHQMISITLYNDKPYGAIWAFQPLGTGTAILVAAVITALFVRLPPAAFLSCVGLTIRQAWLAVITVMLIIGLAYLMNYSGLAYTLGQAAASTGHLFVLLSPFLGWMAVMLSGSDTSGNALFGNLQVVAARQLGLDPVLFAATNSSGGVMGKMISPQNIATGVSVTNMAGQEGVVFARTFVHSIALTVMLGLLVAVQQYLIPGIIPSAGAIP